MDGDGAGDYDPCECVWSHELQTRRLINMIRQSQSYCTDTECFESSEGGADPSGSTAMFFIGFWFLVAVVLFFLRPRSSVPATKGHNGSDNPPPPAATN